MKICLLGFLLIPFFYLEAKVVKYIPSGLKQKSWSVEKACEIMGHKNPLMVDMLNIAWIDCMGNRVSAKKFCLKMMPKKDKKIFFMRGLVDMKKKEMICYQGHSAVLSLECDKTHGRYCKDKKTGCDELKEHYAYGLDTIRSVVRKKKNVFLLNCYYQARNGWKL